jgi:hypothetical protein
MNDQEFIMQEPDWDEINKEIIAEQRKQESKDKAILEQIKQLVSPELFEQIQNEIDESENTVDYKIVDEPCGVFQDLSNDYDDEEVIKVWVNQSVGYCGDDFHGTFDVELPNGKYTG